MTGNNNNKKPGKKNSTGAIAAVAVIALVSLMQDAGGSGILGVLIIIAVIVGIVFAVIKAVSKVSRNAAPAGRKAAQNIGRWSRDSAEIPVSAPASRPKTFVYDDRAYENSTERDRQRRLAQLDNFLKNGIIEKEEYLLIKARYERNGK